MDLKSIKYYNICLRLFHSFVFNSVHTHTLNMKFNILYVVFLCSVYAFDSYVILYVIACFMWFPVVFFFWCVISRFFMIFIRFCDFQYFCCCCVWFRLIRRVALHFSRNSLILAITYYVAYVCRLSIKVFFVCHQDFTK